ncbi:MAG TPA: clostripain-related cysteine peptidase, partial [Candidatus Babeliales bacterium]|nr:clostripain-related cysteine peptidase [Candidatus Babeliales bacterium]
FNKTVPDPQTLAKHIIYSYQQTYSQLTNDFTLSAMDLKHTKLLEENIHMVAQLFIESLDNQKGDSIKNILKMCRSRRLCTSFDEPTYIDLHNFYSNVLNNLHYFQFNIKTNKGEIHKKLHEYLSEGISLTEKMIIANCVGRNLSQAKGVSIYFPEYKINPTYFSTPFAEQNDWQRFIQKYIGS